MMFFAFRAITRGRWRRARAMFWLVAVCALALYAVTAVRYAFPGASASWIAWSAGLDVRPVPSRPALSALGHLVSLLPCASLAERLNLLSAVLVALTLGWVYKTVWFVIFDVMREESAVTHASRLARFGGVVATVAVGLSLPVWQAATRFCPAALDLALVMACAHLLTVYGRSQNLVWLLLFGVLAGLGLAESPQFLLAAPVLGLLAVVAEWKLDWCRMRRLAGAGGLALAVFVLTHFFAARAFALERGLGDAHATVFRLVVAVFREQARELGALLPPTFWFPMLALGVGSAVLAFFYALRALDNRRGWGLLFLGLLLSVSAALMLLNVPVTPWALRAPAGAIPALTYLCFGLGFGLLVTSWRALSLMADPLDVDVPAEEEDEAAAERQPRVFLASRMTGLVAAPLLLLLLAAAGVGNALRLRADDGAFADRAADEVLDGLDGRSWLVANGLLDAHLLIRARERGAALRLLCPYRATEPHYPAHVLGQVRAAVAFGEDAKLRAESLLAYSLHLFIDDLFATDPALGAKAATMGLPDLWYGSGWVPVPDRLFYGGVKEKAGIEAAGLLDRHTRFWRRWEGFIKQPEGSPRQLSHRHRQALRRHLAFVANNLGVTLDDAGEAEAAFGAFRQAREIWPENISALLNLFELVSRGLHPELREGVAVELRRTVESSRDRYPLWALSRHYGYVRNYEMFVKMGWDWAMSSSPGSVLAGLRSAYAVHQDDDRRVALTAMMASLYEMRGDFVQSAEAYRKTLDSNPTDTFAISGLVRLALQRSVVGEAQQVLEAGELAGVSRRLLRQDWAAVYLVSGDLPRARVLLQEMGDEEQAAPMTLAMLAMVMIEQGDTASVETTILPRLAKVASGKDSYFVQVVQGRVWQSKGQSGYRNARLCYQRAAAIRPDVAALQDVILTLDVALEDQKAAEAHALTLLRQRPEHPYANFVIGSIRLEQGHTGEAEAYLARSARAPEPTLAALNNYAQVLCRIRKVDEAETVARRATALAPDRYEAWSTLAFVLASRERLDEAGAALTRATALRADDGRLKLVEGLIAVKRGDRTAAERAIAAAAAVPDLSVADRRELKRLQEELQRQLSGVTPGS